MNSYASEWHEPVMVSEVLAHLAVRPGGRYVDGTLEGVVFDDVPRAFQRWHDGDKIIALCAIDRHERGVLVDDTVVVTVMSNLGFRLAMAERGIGVVQTQVGDRYIVEALERGGWQLGGEQSGHIIFRDLSTTGDGLLTAVQLLDVVARAGRPLSEMTAGAMTRYPQVLTNVRVSGRAAAVVAAMADDIDQIERQLGEQGRVLVRASGTEPLVRVMVEAADQQAASEAAAHLAARAEEAASRSAEAAT